MKVCKQILCALLVLSMIMGPVGGIVSAVPEDQAIMISELKVNNMTEPLGIDTTPRFRWLNSSMGFGKYQLAYQIIVSSTEEKAMAHEGDLWDSGKVAGENNFDIPYAGQTLESRSLYYWAVRVWDEGDNASAWSEVARFGTGIFDAADWQASWISSKRYDAYDSTTKASPMLRKTFAVNKDILSARMYFAGLGLYVLTINGKAPDDAVLCQAETQYNKTVGYTAYDVTAFLQMGTNALAVELGNGFYNCPDKVSLPWNNAPWRDAPKMIMELVLEYADGSMETIVSDESWKTTANGPMKRNSIFSGEYYDARREIPGWREVDFDDSQWASARIANAPAGELTFSQIEPMRKIKSYPAKKVEKIQNGNYLVTCPVMTTGWASIQFADVAGKEITITYGEEANAVDGVEKIIADEGSTTLQQYTYICKGENDVHEPKFSYNGFLYIEIAGYEGALTAEDVTCYQIATDVEHTGTFACGNQMVNALHEIMVRTMENNMQGKPTDTPVYEKIGWTGDYNAAMKCFNYNFDTTNFQTFFMDILQDTATEEGNIARYAPNPAKREMCPPVWTQAYINGIYSSWQDTGLFSEAEKHYATMRNQVLFYLDRMENYIWTDQTYGDWASPNGLTRPSEGGAYYSTVAIYRMLTELTEIADQMGKDEDAIQYKQEAEKIYNAFQKTYYQPEKGYYVTGYWDATAGQYRSEFRQSVNLAALYYGLCPAENRQAVLDALVKDLEKKKYHLDTGCVGTEILMPLLSQEGYGDVALKILLQDSHPSWGYWLANGATTCWEKWKPNQRSEDHFFLGTYDRWLYENLGGIQNVKNGYETVTVRPEIFEEIGYANVSTKTVRGTVGCNWLKDELGTIVTVTVPVGCTAEILLPGNSLEGVAINGVVSTQHPGITSVQPQGDRVQVMVGSGVYEFDYNPGANRSPAPAEKPNAWLVPGTVALAVVIGTVLVLAGLRKCKAKKTEGKQNEENL